MRVSGVQSPQCRLQGTVVSVIIVFVLHFFVLVLVNEFIIFSFLPIFVLVFVNENHTAIATRKVGELVFYCCLFYLVFMFIDCISREDEAVRSVSPSVHPFLLNKLTFERVRFRVCRS